MSRLKKLHENLSRVKVLYVEDEDDVRAETLLFLGRLFDDVSSAVNGEDGLGMFMKNSYDLVVTDLKMPKMDGHDMLSKIHALNKETVLIVMTASDSNMDVTQTQCDAYLYKPVMMMDFVEALESLEDKIIYSSRSKQ